MSSESPDKDGTTRFQERSSNLLSWFTSSAGSRLSTKITLADMRYRGAGRGIVAHTDIPADEELFAIPRGLVLQTVNSELCSKAPAIFSGLGPWDSLIMVIIYEYLRQEKSPWYPYIQVLPTEFDTLMFWTPEELKELQGSAVLDKIGKKSAEQSWSEGILTIMLAHDELFPLPLSDSEARRDRFLELAHTAGSVIMAYAFDLDLDDTGGSTSDAESSDGSDLTEDIENVQPKGLVPLADMLNADASRNNARLFQEGDQLIMRATVDIKAGDEILNDYGPLPRSDLLRMYGYISDSYADYDVVEISADLLENIAASSGASPWYPLAMRVHLEEIGLIEDAFVLGRPISDAPKLHEVIPVDLRILIAAFCRPAGNFESSKIGAQLATSIIAIPEASLLLTSIINRLSDYATSLQEDNEILDGLKGGDESQISKAITLSRYQMAIQVRRGEKEILHQYLRLIQDFLVECNGQVAKEESKQESKRKREEGNQEIASKRAMHQ